MPGLHGVAATDCGRLLQPKQQVPGTARRPLRHRACRHGPPHAGVHAGHGLNYKATKYLSKINQIKEFNIGHFIIGDSIFFGLKKVLKNFKKIINSK